MRILFVSRVSRAFQHRLARARERKIERFSIETESLEFFYLSHKGLGFEVAENFPTRIPFSRLLACTGKRYEVLDKNRKIAFLLMKSTVAEQEKQFSIILQLVRDI